MNCERANELMVLELYGEADGGDAAELKAHLAGCAECRAECAQLAAISRLLTTAQVPDISQEAIERLHEEAVAAPGRGVLKLAERLIAAAAVITVACGGWLWRGPSVSEPALAGEADWQQAAVTLNVEAVSSDAQQLAQWMVEGLTTENGNEQD